MIYRMLSVIGFSWMMFASCLPGRGESTAKPAYSDGFVPDRFCRPLAATGDPMLASLLKFYEIKPKETGVEAEKGFTYRIKPVRETEKYTVFRVLFPSPVVSPDPVNNTVWCEYFRAKVKGPRPAVIVLHPLDLEVGFMRHICERMASAGFDALWLEMAYYGDRGYPAPAVKQLLIMQDLDALISAVAQSVMDIRRAAGFLASRPEVVGDRISLLGCSLGAIMASLTMGVDGNYNKVVILVGGANLAKMFTANQWIIKTLSMANKEKNLTQSFVAQRLKPIEPLTYVHRACNTRVLSFNARQDKVIPPECTRDLVEKLPQVKVNWYDVGHTQLPIDDKFYQEIIDFLKAK